MEKIGQKVHHNHFGDGEIISSITNENNETRYIRVRFAEKTADFAYPSAFDKFLRAQDPEFEECVKTDIEKEKKAAEAKAANKAEIFNPVRKSRIKFHKPISYCSINTFTFKNELGSVKKGGKEIKGYLTYDNKYRCVGVTFMHNDRRNISYGQAEICFYEKYKQDFGEWRLVSINKERVSFERLECLLDEEDSFTATIDPRKGS